jgi:allantoinase
MFHVKRSQMHQRHKLTPYNGEKLAGVIQATFLRGRLIFADGKVLGRPSGSLLERKAH